MASDETAETDGEAAADTGGEAATETDGEAATAAESGDGVPTPTSGTEDAAAEGSATEPPAEVSG